MGIKVFSNQWVGRLPAVTLAWLVLAWVSVAEAGPNVLVLQYSDSHSRYDRVVAFLGLMRKRIAEFHKQFPDGDVLLIANGDISARSAYSYDEGWLNIRLLKHLSKDIPAVWVLGNHEALDWRGVDGRRLYIAQMKYLTQGSVNSRNPRDPPQFPSRSGVVPLAANLRPAPAFAAHLQPYRDIPILGGTKTLRIVGMTLDDFFHRAVYDQQLKPALFTGINQLSLETHAQLELAAKAGADWVIPAYHEEFEKVEALARQTSNLVARNSELRAIKIPAFFAADDHLEVEAHVEGFPVFDSGCEYVFRSVEFSPTGQIVQQSLHRPQDLTRTDRGELHLYLRSDDHTFIREHVRTVLKEAETIHSRGLGVHYGTPDTRQDFKKHRTHLGTLMSDAFVLHGEHVAKREHSDYGNLPVVAMVNSSTYRNEEAIERGELTIGHIIKMNPYFEEAQTFVISGEYFQNVYSAMRAYRARDNVYTPQISSNLVESPTPEAPYQLLIFVDGKWRLLKDIPRLIFVAQHWIAENGYSIPALDALMEADRIEPDNQVLELEILEKYLPQAISNDRYRKDDCQALIRKHVPVDRLRVVAG
jgi:2',3'-cyclic-nucleotide 2'-phosphodiesterase (5'-nucleotidase family)